jgi:hypothetical protein
MSYDITTSWLLDSCSTTTTRNLAGPVPYKRRLGSAGVQCRQGKACWESTKTSISKATEEVEVKDVEIYYSLQEVFMGIIAMQSQYPQTISTFRACSLLQ